MPLNVPVLISDIQLVLKAQGPPPPDPAAAAVLEASQLKLATGLANAINKFVLSANPIPVVTSAGAGTATIS
jgi:hypothetical protein